MNNIEKRLQETQEIILAVDKFLFELDMKKKLDFTNFPRVFLVLAVSHSKALLSLIVKEDFEKAKEMLIKTFEASIKVVKESQFGEKGSRNENTELN
jgi:hypothetical protein